MEGLRCLFIILNLICESPDAEKIYSSELQINDLQGDFHFHCAFYFRILQILTNEHRRFENIQKRCLEGEPRSFSMRVSPWQ